MTTTHPVDSTQSERTRPHVTSDPAVRFSSITFSDNTDIALDPDDVVVLVGPNNSGKSLALRDLRQRLMQPQKTRVIKAAASSFAGTENEFRAYVKRHTRENKDSPGNYSGYGFAIHESHMSRYWTRRSLHNLISLFCLHLDTITRITGSDAPNSISVLEESASHPIHLLYEDDALEKRIARYFLQAFGEDLIVYRSGGQKIPLLVGRRLVPEKHETIFSRSYCERQVRAAVPLAEQGDGMRSFATVILHLLAPTTPSILLLDEPEAFLHPPQARLLGRLIAKERSPRTQLFVATHSPDVLNALLEVASDKLRLLRIRRDGKINRVTELDKEHVESIGTDTLMRYSSVLSGVFHERVIICESDSDCLFYSSLIELPNVCGGQQPDVHFVHANGKHRMSTLAKALTRLDVPVDVIADIDIIQEEKTLKELIQALGGDWAAIQPKAYQVRRAIESQSGLNAGSVIADIRQTLEGIDATAEFPADARTSIRSRLKRSTNWGNLKRAGEAGIPKGQITQQFRELCHLCRSAGLWIVRVGELEGFCRSIGGHGPRWVQAVIETLDLPSHEELSEARDFIKEVWQSRWSSSAGESTIDALVDIPPTEDV